MANRLPKSRMFLFGILWLSLLILSVKLAVAWTTRSISLGAIILHTLVTQFSMLLNVLASLKPPEYQRFQVEGHSYPETLLSLGVAIGLGSGAIYLGSIAIPQLFSLVPPPIPLQLTPLLWQCLGVIFLSQLFLLAVNIYQTKRKHQRFLGFTNICLVNDLWITVLGILCVFFLVQGNPVPDALSAILLGIVSMIDFWLVLRWQLPFLVNQTAIAPEALAQIAYSVGGVTLCTNIDSKGIIGRSVYIKMTIMIHPEVLGYESVIAERIENALKERYGIVSVTIQISTPPHS